MKPKSSEPQCRHRADLDMASQCRKGSWFVFSISFAFHGDNFMLRIPLAILKCLPVGLGPYGPPVPSVTRKSSAILSYWICSGRVPRAELVWQRGMGFAD